MLIVVSACGADVAAELPPTSVRNRLERAPAVLAVETAASAGAITAERRVSGGWSAGFVDLAIESGELALSTDGPNVMLDHLALAVGPIDVPETLLGYGVQLTDIRIELAEPVRVPTEWVSGDEARGDVEVELELAWSLTNHGETSPLGAPDLPRVPAELVVTGNGSALDAELRITAPGELWSWADLLRLQDLTLILSATDR